MLNPKSNHISLKAFWSALFFVVAAIPATSLAFKPGGPLFKPHHQNITKVATPPIILSNWREVHFSEDAIEHIYKANAEVDGSSNFFHADNHFDAESFDQSAKNLNKWLNDIVVSQSVLGNTADARSTLGTAVHLVQDFYAHSNFVEISRNDLTRSTPIPDLGEKDPFSKLKSRGYFRDAPDRGATCDNAGLRPGATMTTGYYDLLMSALGHPYAYLGSSTTEWTTAFNSPAAWFIAITRENVYRTALGVIPLINDPLGTIQVPYLQYANQAIADIRSWPLDRCIHGGDGANAPGINKDDEAREGFEDAYSLATSATAAYINKVVDRFRLAGDEESLCRLIGYPKPEECKAPAGKARVDLVVPQQDHMLYRKPFKLKIAGIDLRPSSSVTIEDGTCEAPENMSSLDFFVTCTVNTPGAKKISIWNVNGHDLAKEEYVNVEAGLISVSQSVVSYLDQITLIAKSIYSQVAMVIWSFTGEAVQKISNVIHGEDAKATKIFESSGRTTITASFEDANGRVIGTSKQTIDVQRRVPRAVEPRNISGPGTYVFKVTGENLPEGLSFVIDGCAGVSEVLAGGSDTQRSFSCTFPPGSVPGERNCVIGVVGAVDGTISKLVSFKITIAATPKPDLVPSAVTQSASSVAPGATATVNWTITNSGNANAAASTTVLRLVSASDATNGTPVNNVASVATGPLATGAIAPQNQLITIAASTVPGSYKIVVVADDTKSAGQGNLTNDFASSGAFTVGSAIPLDPPPVAHYRFDGSLANAIAGSPAGDLVAVGLVPTYEAGPIGQGVNLTPAAGSAAYLSGNPLVTSDTAFTIAAWVKPNTISGINALIYQRTSGGGEVPGCSGNAYNFGIAIYNGQWLFQVSTLGASGCIHGSIFGPSPVAGKFYHVAGVYDKAASKVLFYIDGVLVGQQVVGPNFRLTPSMVTTIGNQPWAVPPQPANSTIDDLRVYNSALSAAQVVQLAANSTSLNPSLFAGMPVATSTTCGLDCIGANTTDGNLLTAANLKTYSGNFVVQSPIPLSVSRVRLTPSMNPNGNVDIEIRTNVDPSAATGTASWVVQFKGVVPMSEKTAKDFTFTSPATNIRQVEIRVNSSPSWVAFYEIEGF